MSWASAFRGCCRYTWSSSPRRRSSWPSARRWTSSPPPSRRSAAPACRSRSDRSRNRTWRCCRRSSGCSGPSWRACPARSRAHPQPRGRSAGCRRRLRLRLLQPAPLYLQRQPESSGECRWGEQHRQHRGGHRARGRRTYRAAAPGESWPVLTPLLTCVRPSRSSPSSNTRAPPQGCRWR